MPPSIRRFIIDNPPPELYPQWIYFFFAGTSRAFNNYRIQKTQFFAGLGSGLVGFGTTIYGLHAERRVSFCSRHWPDCWRVQQFSTRAACFPSFGALFRLVFQACLAQSGTFRQLTFSRQRTIVASRIELLGGQYDSSISWVTRN